MTEARGFDATFSAAKLVSVLWALSPDPIFLTPEPVEALARAARPPYGVLVRFAATTGLRPSELCGLKAGRLDLERGTVEVVEALTVVGGRTELGPTKNGVRRVIQLPPSIRTALSAHLAARAEQLGRPITADDFVFVAPAGGPLRRDLLHKRILRPAARAAHLPESLRAHDLRHTCAAKLITSVPIRRSSRSGSATGRSP